MENSDFDPEFSEYNPIFAELEKLKQINIKKQDEGFVVNFIKKITSPIYLPGE